MLAFLTQNTERSLSFWERVSAWYRQSALHEIITYLEERYFTLEFGVYENFSVAGGVGSTVRNIIIAIALALVAVAIANAYTRQTLGGFIRNLIAKDCLSADRAKTLMELGYFRNAAIRRELSRGTTLRLVVRRAVEANEETAMEANESGEADAVSSLEEAEACESVADGILESEAFTGTTEEANVEEASDAAVVDAGNLLSDVKIDFLKARFYVPEDLRYRAEIRFRTKGSSWWQVALISVLAVVLAAVLCRLLPNIVSLADDLMSWLSPS